MHILNNKELIKIKKLSKILTIDKIYDKLTNANTKKEGESQAVRLLFFLTQAKERKMARNLNYIYALIEYVENTDGYIFRVFEKYEEAKSMQETLENWKNRFEPQRKVTYKIEIYKKGG